jgi:hypothetical protein
VHTHVMKSQAHGVMCCTASRQVISTGCLLVACRLLAECACWVLHAGVLEWHTPSLCGIASTLQVDSTSLPCWLCLFDVCAHAAVYAAYAAAAAVCMPDCWVTVVTTRIFGECLLHVSTFATTRVALPTEIEPRLIT